MKKPQLHAVEDCSHSECYNRQKDEEKKARNKSAATFQRWMSNGAIAVPKSPDATVFVSGHFRRNPKFLSKAPKAQKRHLSFVQEMRSEEKNLAEVFKRIHKAFNNIKKAA